MIDTIEIKNRAQWLAMRAADVTASEIATLFGVHPYRTLLQTYLSKANGDADDGDSPDMRRGRILEPGAAVAVQEQYPDWRLEKANVYVRDTLSKIGATPDYFIHGDTRGKGILECKSAAPEIYEDQWAQGAPQYAVLQCLTQMMLTDAAFGIVACLIDNRAKDLFVFDVPRHPQAEELLRGKVAQFWSAVEAEKMPPPDFARDHDAIVAMFPRGGAPAIDLSADNRLPSLLEERQTLSAMIKGEKARLEAIDAEIKYKMGDAIEARLPGWKLTHKLQSRKEYIVAATEFRVLRVTNLTAKEAA